MRILVFGASGGLGREIVRQALEHKHSVTAFVRVPGGLTIDDPSVRVLEGNVADAAAVAAAVPGHDAVISALGVSAPLKHDPDVIDGVRHIVQSMAEYGVRRFIYVSFIGVRESRHAVGFILRYIAPIPLRNEIADHEAKEALIRASDLDWTIVRPPKMTTGSRTRRYRSGEEISTRWPMPLLSRADVADFIMRELVESNYVRKAPRLLQ